MFCFVTRIIILFGIFISISNVLSFEVKDSDDFCFAEESGQCKTVKRKGYILYDVNKGEGFNLRRDVYIRIAPLVKQLNERDENQLWTLVLPPWGNMPHWPKSSSNIFYPWETFFDVSQIRQYIPAIELQEFFEEYEYDNVISAIYQLQHFPFDPNDKGWIEKIETEVPCENDFSYARSSEMGSSSLYSKRFWGVELLSRNVSCMSLRGQASTLINFILNLHVGGSHRSILFDRAEVILWDDYGGTEWWQARKSLKFSTMLNTLAIQFLEKFNVLPRKFVAIHLRRKDFLYGGRKDFLPSIEGAVKQGISAMRKSEIGTLFVATDAVEKDILELKLVFEYLTDGLGYHLLIYQNSSISPGEAAIVEQIICSRAKYFLGTPDSTFTLRIFEEREILGLNPDTTFNYLCPDDPDLECKQPTKWRIKF